MISKGISGISIKFRKRMSCGGRKKIIPRFISYF